MNDNWVAEVKTRVFRVVMCMEDIYSFGNTPFENGSTKKRSSFLQLACHQFWCRGRKLLGEQGGGVYFPIRTAGRERLHANCLQLNALGQVIFDMFGMELDTSLDEVVNALRAQVYRLNNPSPIPQLSRVENRLRSLSRSWRSRGQMQSWGHERRNWMIYYGLFELWFSVEITERKRVDIGSSDCHFENWRWNRKNVNILSGANPTDSVSFMSRR